MFGGKNEIVSGIADLVNTALVAIMGAKKGEEMTKKCIRCF